MAMEKIGKTKVIRLKKKRPAKESPIQAQAKLRVEKYYKENPSSPFIKIGEIMMKEYRKRKRSPA